MHFLNTLAFLPIFVSCLTTTTVHHHLTGHIPASAAMTFIYAPFPVAPGALSLTVYQNYSFPLNNSIDLGIFSPLGIGPVDAFRGSGSRGWSGGFRKNFTLGLEAATPGYLAGAVEAGEWNVVLGPYVVVEDGVDWWVDVDVVYTDGVGEGGGTGEEVEYWRPSNAQTDYEPLLTSQGRHGEQRERVSQGGGAGTERWLRGDFHMHTIYSDGRYLPSEQMERAVNKGLDFIFFSEHNSASGNSEVGKWRPEGAEELLVGRAIEVTTRHGHWQAIGLDRGQQVEWRYTNETDGYAQAAEGVRQSGALISVNHPYANCSRCDWTLDWDHHDAIEVWNGRWSPSNELAVKKWHEELVVGKRTTAIGGSDAHHPPDQNGLPTTVVRSRAKSQAGIVQAVREGAVYLVESPGMDIELRLTTAEGVYEVGQMVPAGHGTATLVARGFADGMACFISEAGYFHNESLSTTGPIEVRIDNSAFVRVEIRNSTDTMLGLTNAIFC